MRPTKQQRRGALAFRAKSDDLALRDADSRLPQRRRARLVISVCVIYASWESIAVLVADTHCRTIWPVANGDAVEVIDQTKLPHRFETLVLRTAEEGARAIKEMVVRGAPLIGVTAAYAFAMAMRADPSNANMARAGAILAASRPTAVNLRWALERMRARLECVPPPDRSAVALAEANAIAEEEIALSRAIAVHGAALIADRAASRDRVNILTHCNAGWLATVDWGTALAPVYEAHRSGIPVHVWVDETRPRNQGASLTAWELQHEGVPFTLIADNTGGHLMQHGQVDLCLVGSDRTTRTGDVCNKIGTYLKALAAHDNGVPFFVALPSSTIDWGIEDGLADIPIEQRSPDELTHVTGLTADGGVETVCVVPKGAPAANYAFDVTPARLVTGLITERGVCAASAAGFPSTGPGRSIWRRAPSRPVRSWARTRPLEEIRGAKETLSLLGDRISATARKVGLAYG